jgi:FkbM family methyltransferase
MQLNHLRARLRRVCRAVDSWSDRYRMTRAVKCWALPRVIYRRADRCAISFDNQLNTYVHSFRGVAYVRDRLGIAPPSVFLQRINSHALRGGNLPKGAVVVELGAGTGTETVLLAKMVGCTGRILAIEAHPRTARLLGRCVELNDLTNVDVRCLAVTDQPGMVTITSEAADVSNSIRGSDGDPLVMATTLDHLTAGLVTIDLLKMNIEGAERPALQAAASTLAKAQHVSVSCHDFKAERTGDEWFRTRRCVEEILLEAGFDLAPPIASTPLWVRDTVHGSRRQRVTTDGEL